MQFLFSLTQKFPFVIKAMLYKKKPHTSLKEELEWEIMAKRLKVANPARCIGCYSCMMACARTWYDTISLKNSRINIQTRGGIETPYAAIVCHACIDPPCMRACPLGALTKRKGGEGSISTKRSAMDVGTA